MSIDYEEAMKISKKKAKRKAELMWPEDRTQKIKEWTEYFTWRYFREYITP